MSISNETGEFDVEKYLKQVLNSADGQLTEGIYDLKADLNKIAHSKGLGDINQSKLDQACEKLREKTKSNFNKNLTKFVLYAAKNVFQPPADITSANKNQAASSSSSSKSPDIELAELEAQVEEAKQRYLHTQENYIKITSECRDMDRLIKEMRNALFTLRVASQSFEDLGDNTHNLDDATATIQTYERKLRQYCEEANGLLARLDETGSVGSRDEAAMSIHSGSTDAVRRFTQQLNGK